MAETNKLNDIIQTALDNIHTMVDANTVIGDPITTANGTTIIPVSKVFVGFASGGIDYLGKNASEAAKQNGNNFGGGGGTGLTVAPVAFLVVSADGNVEMLNVNSPVPPANDPVSSIASFLERSPELIEKIKSIFSKKKDDSEPDTTAE